jgi:hypothetical protein
MAPKPIFVMVSHPPTSERVASVGGPKKAAKNQATPTSKVRLTELRKTSLNVGSTLIAPGTSSRGPIDPIGPSGFGKIIVALRNGGPLDAATASARLKKPASFGINTSLGQGSRKSLTLPPDVFDLSLNLIKDVIICQRTTKVSAAGGDLSE